MNTVKIAIWWEPPGAPYRFEEIVDTGLTAELWDDCPAVMQEQFAQQKIRELMARQIETGWSVHDD